jgi:protein-tyrosine-phosphatase
VFKHLYKGEKAQAKSAGIILDLMHPYMSRTVVRVLRDKNIPVMDNGAKKVDDFLLKWADRVIIVADNVAPEYFKGKLITLWEINDCAEDDAYGVSKRVDMIEQKVQELVKSLG